jgi:PAS domain S-box-containing protein
MEFEWQSAIVPNPLTLPRQARVNEAVDCFRANRSFPDRCSCILILEQDHVVGLLSYPDLMQWLGESFSTGDHCAQTFPETTVAQIMTPPLTIAATAATAERLQNLFQETAYPGILIWEQTAETSESSAGCPLKLNQIHLITPNRLFQSLLAQSSVMESPASQQIALPSSEPDIDSVLETESEIFQLFQATFEQAAVGIAHVSPEGQFLGLNRQFCEITGYDRDEMMNLTFQDITYPDDLSNDLEYVRQLLENRLKTYSMEKRYIRKDGSLTWVNLTVALVHDPNGNPKYFISVIQDINDRKKLEVDRYNASATLAKYQSLYEDLLSNLSDAVFVTDDIGNFVFISSNVSGIFGYTSLEILAYENISEILGSDFVNTLNLVKVRGEISNQECQIYDKEGEIHHLLINIKSVDLNPGNILYICRDITERKQTEDELHLYEQIISTTHDLMAFIDCNYQYRVVNDAYLKRFAQSKADIVGKTPADIIGRETFEQVIKPKLDRCFGGEVVQYQAWFPFADQQLHYLDAVYTPYREQSGTITGAVASIRDLTSSYQAEQTLSILARRAEVLLRLPAAADSLSEKDFLQYGQEMVEDLTASQVSFIHFVHEDQQTLELVVWSQRTLQHHCTAAFDSHYSIDRAGIWADALRQRKPVICNDYPHSPHKTELPEGHTTLHRLITVPVIDNGAVVMLAGVGNKATDYTDLDVETLQLLSNEIWRIIQGKHTLAKLQQLNQELEQRVEERAERLHLAAQAARIGIWDWDVVNDRLTWDDRMYEIYGISPTTERMVQDWADRLHPEDAEKTQILLHQALAGGKEFQTTFRIVQPGGKIRWIETHSLVKRNNLGQGVRMIGINVDVSNRKQVEEQIERESIFRQQILDHMAEGLCVCTIQPQYPALSFSLWNPQMVSITGYSLAEINTMNWSKVLYARSDTRHRVVAAINDIREGKNISQEWEIVRKDGEKRTVSISTSSLPNEDNAFLILGIIQDITDRKLAEIELKNTQAKFQRLVDDIGDNFMVFSYSTTDQALTYVSSGIRSIFGLFRQDVLDKDWGEVIDWLPESMDRRDQYVWDFEQQHVSFQQFEMDFIHKNGQTRTVQISQHPVFDRYNKLIAIEGVLEDVTQQRKYKAMLQQTNNELERATRLKDEFLASMSHELRTPLNAILGMSDVLLEGILGDINDKQRQSLETIQRSGNHLLELINDILDLSKIEAGKLELNYEATNIESLCSSSMAFIRQHAVNKQITLSMTIVPNLAPVILDERRIRQVLVNLLSNAVKFTPKGGSIHLDVFCHSPDSDPSSHFLRLAVTDTGIGISPEDQTKLFQPFVQIDGALNRQYSGTGLGLSLVRRIVHLHQGTVGLNSEMGVGSCFWVDLPCKFDTSQPENIVLANPSTHAETIYPACPTRPPLILLAEDNEANVQTLQNYLGAKGYDLAIANNGQEAIEMADSMHPDLILMDIQMPKMDGLEAIRKLRANTQMKDIPIIALTALAMTGDDNRCLDAGANAYVTKPVRLKQLMGTIQNLLQSSAGSRLG